MINEHIGKVGQSRQVQDPRKLFEYTEGKYRDPSLAIPIDKRYPRVNAAPDKRPFIVRGIANGG